MTYIETPVHACTLYVIEVPKTAGNTGFANMIAAYDALSVQIKERLQGLIRKHDASRNSTGRLRKGFEEYYGNVTQVPGFVHPLVRVNPETGVRALYLGRRDNAYVMGLGIDESEALLEEVWAHVAKLDFTWAQEWRLAIWSFGITAIACIAAVLFRSIPAATCAGCKLALIGRWRLRAAQKTFTSRTLSPESKRSTERPERSSEVNVPSVINSAIPRPTAGLC